jgi:hypothetical protein
MNYLLAKSNSVLERSYSEKKIFFMQKIIISSKVLTVRMLYPGVLVLIQGSAALLSQGILPAGTWNKLKIIAAKARDALPAMSMHQLHLVTGK